MTQYLPPNLLALFAPRDPIPYFPHIDILPWDKKSWPYHGFSQFTHLFEDPNETPPATRAETKEERIARKQQEREGRERERLKEQVESWDVTNDPNVVGDPFKTLFIGRINFDTSESKLRREFESYGRIKNIQVITSSVTGKPRGYAFIEYEKERDMHSAYKHADGKKIDGRRVVVDVERGRTVKSWNPRRLGGGLGGTRRGSSNENIKYSGRVDDRKDQESRESRDKDRGQDTDNRDRDRDNRDKDNRDKDRDKDRDRDQGSSRKEKDWDSKDRDHGHDRDRERDRGSSRKEKDRDSKDRDRERDRDREKDKSKDWDSKDRDREREKDKSKDRSRDRDKKRHRDRDRDRDYDRDGRSEKRRRVDDDRLSERQDNGIDESLANSES